MVLANAAKSKSEARRLIEGGGVRIDDEKISDVNAQIPEMPAKKANSSCIRAKKCISAYS